MVKMENCGGQNQILKVDNNVTVSLTKNCEIIVKGCAQSQSFNTLSASKPNDESDELNCHDKILETGEVHDFEEWKSNYQRCI